MCNYNILIYIYDSYGLFTIYIDDNIYGFFI